MITEIQLKQLGFEMRKSIWNGKQEWCWGSRSVYTQVLPAPIYEPILRYSESDSTIYGGFNNHKAGFTIAKPVSTTKQIDEIINFASFIMAG